MKVLPHCLSILALVGLLVACDTDSSEPTPTEEGTGIFEFNITTRVSGESFVPEVVYKNALGRSYFVNALKMYIADITLIDEQGQETVLSEIELFDLTQPGSLKAQHGEGTYKQFEVPAKDYAGVKFGIGVPRRLNHEDPADFAPEHPLSVFNGMHWNWASGYRFMILEGKIDSSETADGTVLGRDIVYHMGLDTLYREISYMAPDQSFSVPTGDELQYVVELDLNRMFFRQGDTLDMNVFSNTHSVPPGSEAFKLAEKIVDNLVNNSLFKVPL